ncbi:hypothetical protein N7532_001962 [Penicillium argentinense]|uniref:Rhodopsin domain-containing protein n=1 Tax=Penicillium argentinense TaxID=1131581 RepID=A0A9W9G527_9EURO|nr:uncharacterized protein N7532_001962 [Penicillium argentinense]KAJ5111427.1 hypothetical protein N7532_001962 [Penicillium argentinense]
MESLQDLPHNDISWRIWVGAFSTIIPATVVVALRYVARYVSRAGLWWDDYTIAVSLMFNWAMVSLRCVQVAKFGLGKHAYDIAPAVFQSFGKSLLGSQVIYFTNAVFTKASLLLLYYRIFGVVRGFRWALAISFFLVIAYFIAASTVSIAGCSPVSKFWDPSLPGYCVNEVAFFRWNGFGNMALDILVLCLPYPMAWRLQTSPRQKLILTGIFLLGAFVCVVSILRITSFSFSSLEDATYVSVSPSTWSSIEQSVGIICACLPTLRPLVRELNGNSWNSAKRNSASPTASNRSCFPFRGSSGDEENNIGIAKPVCAQQAIGSKSATPESGLLGSRGRESWQPDQRPKSPTSPVFLGDDVKRQIPRPETFA